MKYNILVIDDEIYSLEDICACIDKEALNINRIFTAINTTRARAILDEEDIHIIISDIDMPGGDGPEFLRSVRDTDADTPCIFITNYADFSYALEAIHLNVLDYLLKPVEPDKLHSVIERAEQIVSENLKFTNGPTGSGYDASGAPGKDSYVISSIAFIEDNLLNSITREDVSDYVHVTPDHLDRLFREQLGMSVFRCIMGKKIEYSKGLLADTDRPISEIACDLGYCNLSNFSAAFKKMTQMTPAEFRKSKKTRRQEK